MKWAIAGQCAWGLMNKISYSYSLSKADLCKGEQTVFTMFSHCSRERGSSEDPVEEFAVIPSKNERKTAWVKCVAGNGKPL